MAVTVLVLGTGQAQADLIRALKERGVYTYACSSVSGDVAEKYVDEFRQINIVDQDAVYDWISECGADHVYSVGSDIAMPTVAAVAKRANLKCFVSERTARICNTKSLLRSELGDGFIGNVRFQELTSADDELTIGFPLVIKPSDSQGQRGVFRVSSVDALKARFDDSARHSSTGKVIVEEYIDGSEVSVNTFSINGEIVFMLISDRIAWSGFPGGIIHKHNVPSVFETDSATVSSVRNLVSRVLARIGILDGPAYFQIKITPKGEPKLIEVTPRLDGCHMWRLIKYATGVDLLGMTIDLLLTGECDIADTWSMQPFETEFLCMPPQSTFTKAAFDIREPVFLQWYYDEGDTIKTMNGYMEKCGYQINSM